MVSLTGGSTVSIIISAVDDFSGTISDADKQISDLSGKIAKNMGIAGAAITAAGVGGALALGSFALKAAEVADIQDAFNTVVGEEGVELLEELQNATLGTVSKYDLMSLATATALKGLDTGMLPAMVDYAQRLKDAGIITGSVSDAVDTMTQALVTGRTAGLAQFGIDIENTSEFMDVLNQKLTETTAPTSDAADAWAKLQVQFSDFSILIGETIAPILETLIGYVSNIIDWFSGLSKGTQEWIAFLIIGATVLALILGPILILVSLLPAIAAGIALITTVSLPWLAIIIAIIAGIALLATGIYLLIKYHDDIQTKIEEVWTSIKDFFTETWNSILEVVETKVNSIIGIINSLIDVINNVTSLIGITGIPELDEVSFTTTEVGDFIVTPSGTLETDPNDYIIGTKDPSSLGGGGGNITVNIDTVSGMDPDAVAAALSAKLREVITYK